MPNLRDPFYPVPLRDPYHIGENLEDDDLIIIKDPDPLNREIYEEDDIIEGELDFDEEKENLNLNIAIHDLKLNDIPLRPMTDLAIVLDLDETLVHTFLELDDYKRLNIDSNLDLKRRTYVLTLYDVGTARGQGEMTQLWGIKRPHWDLFLTFCFSYFKIVVVWSAGKYEYVHSIVQNLFSQIADPHAVLTWDDCIKKESNICDKNLEEIYKNKELGKYLRPENTLILDDRTVSFRNNPDNGIEIPPYEPSLTLSSLRLDDIALKQFRAWLLRDEVRKAKDVRELNKDIFNKSMRELLSD